MCYTPLVDATNMAAEVWALSEAATAILLIAQGLPVEVEKAITSLLTAMRAHGVPRVILDEDGSVDFEMVITRTVAGTMKL